MDIKGFRRLKLPVLPPVSSLWDKALRQRLVAPAEANC
jgi:hypothetical protein